MAEPAERRSGPIRVNEADFEITMIGLADLSPDFSPARDATHLDIEFAAPLRLERSQSGFSSRMANQAPMSLTLERQLPAQPAAAAAGPEDFVAKANGASTIETLHLSGNRCWRHCQPV